MNKNNTTPLDIIYVVCIMLMRVDEYAITELTRSMKLAAEREEYASAADMKRIKEGIELHSEKMFSESDIVQLQKRIHQIVGDGEVMQEFKRLLGSNTN